MQLRHVDFVGDPDLDLGDGGHTAAWSEMMIHMMPAVLTQQAKADLYLMLATDAPFIDDGTRVFGEPAVRERFDGIARRVLADAEVTSVEIRGSWDERFEAACAAIDAASPGA